MARTRDVQGIGLGVVALAAAVWLAASWRRPPPQPAGTVGPREAASATHGTCAARPEGGEGCDADSPSEIPARGWWEIVKRTALDVSENRLMTEAAGITFYALLSVFPALAAMVSLYGLFADPSTITSTLDALSGVVPGGGMDVVREEIQRLTSNGPTTLGLGLVIGFATSLWSSNQAVKALFDSLNTVYGEKEKRGFIYRTLLSLAFTLGTIVFVLLAISAVVALPVVLNYVGLSRTSELLLRFARWPALLVVVTLFLSLIYRYGPSREQARWRWVTWGGAFAAVVWLLGSAAFSWYAAHFGSFNRTYGSLGAVVGFMTWMWLSGIVALIGAELDSEMERQATHGTTEGSERSMGLRGAGKTDTLAHA